MTVDELCFWLENEGFQAKLSSPAPNAAMIETAAQGVSFTIIQMKSHDEFDTTVLGFAAHFDPMSLNQVNSLNNELGMAKVMLDDDGVTVGYRMFIKEDDLTANIFQSHFMAWLGDMQSLVQYFGRQ